MSSFNDENQKVNLVSLIPKRKNTFNFDRASSNSLIRFPCRKSFPLDNHEQLYGSTLKNWCTNPTLSLFWTSFFYKTK